MEKLRIAGTSSVEYLETDEVNIIDVLKSNCQIGFMDYMNLKFKDVHIIEDIAFNYELDENNIIHGAYIALVTGVLNK